MQVDKTTVNADTDPDSWLLTTVLARARIPTRPRTIQERRLQTAVQYAADYRRSEQPLRGLTLRTSPLSNGYGEMNRRPGEEKTWLPNMIETCHVPRLHAACTYARLMCRPGEIDPEGLCDRSSVQFIPDDSI